MELQFGDGINRSAFGTLTAAGAALTLDLGFEAKYVKFVNATDRIEYEKYAGMSATQTIKTVAAGTRTLDTADAAIAIDGNVVTIAAAAAINAKVCYFIAY